MSEGDHKKDDEPDGFIPLGAAGPLKVPLGVFLALLVTFLVTSAYLAASGIVEVSSPIDRWMPGDWVAENKAYCKDNPEVLRCRGAQTVSSGD